MPEMRGSGVGGAHLRVSDVAATEHADFPVGVRKRGGPLDGVVAVVGLVDERVELSFGAVTAARVFHDDDVAALSAANADAGFVAAVVGSADEEDGEFAVGLRAIDVGFEDDAVAHGDFDVAIEDDLVGVRGERCRGGEQEREQAEEPSVHFGKASGKWKSAEKIPQCSSKRRLSGSKLGRFGYTPRCFSEECANVLESIGCGYTGNGSVEGVESRRVAATRDFGWRSNFFEAKGHGRRNVSSRRSIARCLLNVNAYFVVRMVKRGLGIRKKRIVAGL